MAKEEPGTKLHFQSLHLPITKLQHLNLEVRRERREPGATVSPASSTNHWLVMTLWFPFPHLKKALRSLSATEFSTASKLLFV